MIFHKHNINNLTYPNKKLKINNKEIEFSRSTRYLGLIIDDKLTWAEHFTKVTKRAKQYLMQLLGTFSKSWGPRPNLVRWVYGSIVLARLCYAPMTWGFNIKLAHRIDKLRQVNRLASLMMCPTRNKSPTRALELIHDLVPLEIYIQQQALKTYTRLESQLDRDWTKTKQKNPNITPHLKYLKNLKQTITGGLVDTETTHKDISEKDYQIKIDPIKGRERPTGSQINIYTDGSKTKNGTGAGYVILDTNNNPIHTQSIHLTQSATIFQAELTAITEVCKYLKTNNNNKHKYIKIFSDSKASLQALSNPKCKSNTVYDTHCALNTLSQDVKCLRLTWIKAHAGHDGNELADEYAKLGVIDTTYTIHTYITNKELQSPIEIYTYHKWKEKWTNYKYCRQTKLFYPEPSKKMGKYVRQLARTDLSLLIQGITGQNNLNYLNNLITPQISPLCRFCEEEDETFEHILTDCPVFYTQRINIFKFKPILQSWTPGKLIQFIKTPDILDAFNTNLTEEHK